MTSYSETIHPWLGIFSQFTLSHQHPIAWDTQPVDFVLLCFAVELLNSHPRRLGVTNVLDTELRSMYLMSKAWISLLEGAGLNTIEFVKARLLINTFEISHRLYPAAYLSIAAIVRAADALAVFLPQGAPHSFSEKVTEEYRLMWCGIAILDRCISHSI